MITAVLTMIVVWCLFYGRISLVPLIVLCVALGIALAIAGKHSHTHFYTIDVLAQTSRINRWNSTLKFWITLALMVICVASKSPIIGLFLTITMLVITVFGGKIRISDYVHLMALPVSFLLLGSIALIFEIARTQSGVLSAQIFGYWFCITPESQIRAMLVIARALGAVSCLYALSLSTTMSEIVGVLRRAHFPDVIVELMYLIYRYIFVLLNMYHTMNDASKSRLGHIDYKTSIKTTANLYSNLLSRSYRQANKNYEAMESRCLGTEICFFERKKQIMPSQIFLVATLLALTLGTTIWLY